MIKRLIIWIFETVLEVVLLGVMLAILLGHDQNAFAKDVFINGSGILLMFFATGYLLTTIIVRALWKGKSLWQYPCIAVALYLLHFQIMNVGVGVAFEPADRLRIRIFGAFIVFVCTCLGTMALRKRFKSSAAAIIF